MGKRLVTKREMEQLCRDGSKRVYVFDQVILSPGAKDLAREKRVKISYLKDNQFRAVIYELVEEDLQEATLDSVAIEEIVERILERI